MRLRPADAARQRNGHAVYACGFGLFWSAGVAPLAVWSALAHAVRDEGQSYSRARLERVPAGS